MNESTIEVIEEEELCEECSRYLDGIGECIRGYCNRCAYSLDADLIADMANINTERER